MQQLFRCHCKHLNRNALGRMTRREPKGPAGSENEIVKAQGEQPVFADNGRLNPTCGQSSRSNPNERRTLPLSRSARRTMCCPGREVARPSSFCWDCFPVIVGRQPAKPIQCLVAFRGYSQQLRKLLLTQLPVSLSFGNEVVVDSLVEFPLLAQQPGRDSDETVKSIESLALQIRDASGAAVCGGQRYPCRSNAN